MKPLFSVFYIINEETFSEKLIQMMSGNKLGECPMELFVYDLIDNEATHNELEECRKAIAQEQESGSGNMYAVTLTYQACPEKSPWQCYNEGLAAANGKYVLFSGAEVSFSGGLLRKASRNFEKYAVSAVSVEPYQKVEESAAVSQLYFARRDWAIDLTKKPFHLNLQLESLLIEREAIGDLRFREDLAFETGEVFLIQLYEKIQRYAVIKGRCNINRYLSGDSYNYDPLFHKEWYNDSLRNVYLPLLNEQTDSVIRQAGVLQLLQIRLSGNLNDRSKSVLNPEERDEFFALMKEMLSKMDDDVLIQYKWPHKRTLQRFVAKTYLQMKYDTQKLPIRKTVDEEKGLPAVAIGDSIIENYDAFVINILAVNTEKGGLSIDGELANMYFREFSDIKMYFCINGRRIEVEHTGIYLFTKYFAKTVHKGYTFRVFVPEADYAADITRGHFEVELLGDMITVPCVFKKVQARLRENIRFTFWNFDKHVLQYDGEKKEFVFARATAGRKLKNEVKYVAWMCKRIWDIRKKKNDEPKEARQALVLYLAYLITRPYYKRKNIWVTFDQLFKGGDNGEYYFRHVRKNHRDVSMYYILNDTAAEYPELKSKYGHILKFNSFKSRLISLHAKMIFATRVDVKLYCGFTAQTEKYFRGIYNAEVVCLQHGLTIQKIAQYQNRLFDNTKYYFCVSPYEVENINNALYGYTDDMISLTGAPRYDGLTGAPKKQILITPTWRRNVTAGTNKKGSNHEYSVNFKQTTYYQIYNTLINDQRIIDCAKETGYKLIYLIHPILSPQVDDFDKNEFVEIVPGVDINYETILKESSLMVTDYSGIQFDFAYMRRPLIYYHPDALPPQYDEGNLKYDTMGFGPVCKTNDEIVEALCRFMRQDCRLDDMYRERIEKFFPYSNQDSCERVYQAAVEYQKTLKQ